MNIEEIDEKQEFDDDRHSQVRSPAQESILGYNVYASGIDECLDEIESLVLAPRVVRDTPKWLACLNPHSFVQSIEDPVFRGALENADFLIPDGTGIVLASRMFKGRIRSRITGMDIFQGIHGRVQRRGHTRVFFIGSDERTLAKISENMYRDYPAIHVAGTLSPPYKASYSREEIATMIKTINCAKPDVLWVGMTAPKQELWIYENKADLDVKFAGAIGAVFDFYAGTIKRPSRTFQRFGLEWLPRLMREPKRLWRRSLVSMPRFLYYLVRFKVRSATR